MIENDNDYIYDYDFNILKHNTKKYINIILNVLNRRDLTTNEQKIYYKLKNIYNFCSSDFKLSLKQIIIYNEIIIALQKYYYNFIILDNFIIFDNFTI
jgi:hypothetical protein